jgi:hypothetical protein
MKPERILSKYTEHTEQWLSEVKNFKPEDFAKPHKSGWSAAQVVDHICKTTHKCLAFAELCVQGNGEKGHAAFGPALFSLMGAFPPVKIRVKNPPKGVEDIYSPESINMEQAYESLYKALSAMQGILDKIRTSNPGMRAEHWAGGWFNALQWYHCAEMHIKHHFRQLKRIKKGLE